MTARKCRNVGGFLNRRSEVRALPGSLRHERDVLWVLGGPGAPASTSRDEGWATTRLPLLPDQASTREQCTARRSLPVEARSLRPARLSVAAIDSSPDVRGRYRASPSGQTDAPRQTAKITRFPAAADRDRTLTKKVATTPMSEIASLTPWA